MTSQINPNNIDGTYPVAGVPNNTQGMRDNFTNTRTNFQYAADEITELQSKAVLKAAITGTTLDNNMNNQEIYAVQLRDVSYAYSALTATAGSINIDYAVAPYQQINLSGPISLSFTNWPTAGTAGLVRVQLNITNVSQTVTLPAAVSLGIELIAGVSPGTPGVSNTITFGTAGIYDFDFTTVDGGTTITILDQSRSPGKINTPLAITNTTASTSKTTGALVVTGGVGIGGNLNVGGNLRTYTNTGNVSFQVLDTGVVEFKAPAAIAANTAGALNIVGSASGNYQPVTNAGGMVHITGNDGVTSRITNDAFGTGVNPVFVGRLARGTVDSPTPPQNNDVLLRFVGVGWNGSGSYGPSGGGLAPCTIDFVAKETYSGTTQGSEIQFYNAPVGSNVRTLSATITSTGITVPANVTASNVSVSSSLNVTGNIRTFTNTGNISFQALNNGLVQINIPTVAANTGGGVNIVGSSDGGFQNIVNAGGMLHITGNDNTSARTIIDTFSSNAAAGYSGLILRRGRGSATSPSAVQSGDVIGRVGATAYGNVGFITLSGNSAAGIDFVATENQTTANAGSKIEFYSTTAGTATRTLSLTLNGNVSTFPGNVAVGGAGGIALTDGGTVGYGVGAGGTVAQGGNKSTGVTLDKPSGQITMQNTNLAADTSVSFTLTNSTIANHDVLVLNIVGGVATAGTYNLDAVCNTGSAVITVRNITGGTLGEAIVLRYVVIKGSVT